MDRLNKEERSRLMSCIKASNTGLEERLRAVLTARGVGGFTRSPKNLVGKPDFVFRRSRLVVFLDSCFWHGCPTHLRMPQSNLRYWRDKIENNRKRDMRVRRELKRLGWRVVRVWEHELKFPERVLAKIIPGMSREVGAARNNQCKD